MNYSQTHIGYLGDTKIFLGISDDPKPNSSIKFNISCELDNIEFDISPFEAQSIIDRLQILIHVIKLNCEGNK